MKIHLKILAVAALSVLLAAPVLAVEGEEVFADQHSGPGPYVVLNIGRSAMTQACNGGFANCTAANRSAIFATYGYDYTPMWALEATWGKIGDISSTPSITAMGLSVEGVGTVHLGDFLGVYAKAGVAYGDFRASGPVPAPYILNSSGISPAGGVGLRLDFSPHLIMRIQGDYWGSYTVLQGANKMNIVTTTIGLMWRY